ncbi:hypothetical protein ACYJ1Y_05380 [Natrialbaceae archaeon A-gly3]
MTQRGDAARMELEPDAFHQDDKGYYVDCPECGSAATITNVIEHGRCNGYLDQEREETDVDEAETDLECTAQLSLELVYDSEGP